MCTLLMDEDNFPPLQWTGNSNNYSRRDTALTLHCRTTQYNGANPNPHQPNLSEETINDFRKWMNIANDPFVFEKFN